MSVPSRIDWVKRWLLSRKDITHQTLIDAGGGWRLSASIYHLRHRTDPPWPITTARDHNGVAHYWLPRGWAPKKGGKKNGRHRQ